MAIGWSSYWCYRLHGYVIQLFACCFYFGAIRAAVVRPIQSHRCRRICLYVSIDSCDDKTLITRWKIRKRYSRLFGTEICLRQKVGGRNPIVICVSADVDKRAAWTAARRRNESQQTTKYQTAVECFAADWPPPLVYRLDVVSPL